MMRAKEIMVSCPYCGERAKLVTGKDLYPHRPDLYAKPFYACLPCDAYVGCHEGTTNPLGRLANFELRKAKMAAHAVFDPIWRSGTMRRTQAYQWLAGELGIDPKDCHIGMFDVDACRRVVDICRNQCQKGTQRVASQV